MVVITGMGVVSVAGVGRDAFTAALLAGTPTLPAGPVARIADFGARAVIDGKALRRMARLSQMALVAGKQALAEARPTAAPERSGIVLGTGLGTIKETTEFLKGYIASGPEGASPMLFPSSVMNAAAGQMALELGWRGVNSTVNHRELSSLGALQLACDALELGRADVILCGATDEAGDPSVEGYRAFGALTRTTMKPYGLGRDGMVLGEGAAVFVLEREADARARGATVLARIAGYAATGDHRARIGWSAHGEHREGTVAMRSALAAAGVSPSSVGWIAGGGCGLGLDTIEARAIDEACPGRPLSSVLGQTGEMMTSSALRLAAALVALERQRIPATVGTDAVDPALPIADLVRTPRDAPLESVLIPSLSEGGANAALVLTRA